MSVEMIDVECDDIHSIGYDETMQDLYIRFEDNTITCFKNVQINTFVELLYSSSKKEFADHNIYLHYDSTTL